jgi:hypothetical protein
VRRSVSPVASSSSSIQAVSTFRPEIATGSVTFSSAVSIGSRLKNWKTKPMWRRRSFVRSLSFSVLSSTPSIATEPLLGRSSPARMCISVDLPEPDGPITAVRWPRGIVSDTPRSASTAVSPAP